MSDFDIERLAEEPVFWFGGNDQAVQAFTPIQREISLIRPWSEVTHVRGARLESVIARMLLIATRFDNRPPEGFGVRVIEKGGWAVVNFAHSKDFVEWMGPRVAPEARTYHDDGLVGWALVGGGALHLGARAHVSIDVVPKPYEDITMLPSHVTMFVAPLRPEFAAQMPTV